jgi:hypothetical protein
MVDSVDLMSGTFLTCAPMPASGTCPSYTNLTAAQSDWLFERATGISPTGPFGGWQIEPWCDELSVQNACCFGVDVFQWAVGRPFRIAGESRVADDECNEGWVAPIAVEMTGLNRRARRRLATLWTRTAKAEHASVAAFARFNLQLMQLGAPADMVAQSTQAMADEIRHARDSFGIASAFAGCPVGVGLFEMSGALDGADVTSIVLETVREGCIAETIAATQAAVARDACTDPAIRAVLDRVAEDEARHAALAWRVVRWAVDSHPELREVVASVFSEGLELTPVAFEPMADTLRGYGALSEAQMQDVAQVVFQDVILPCAREMLQCPVGVGLRAAA